MTGGQAGILDADRIAEAVRGARVGRRVIVLEDVASTNDYLLDAAAVSNIDGWVVLAERQSAGRGRRGRQWQCPRGAGVLCTVGVSDPAGAVDAALLALAVPVAVCVAIESVIWVACEVKWPNDILVRRRKVAGVLIETRARREGGLDYAIGIGINCLQHRGHFPAALRATSTSLDLEAPDAVDRHAVAVGLLTALNEAVGNAVAPRAEAVCAAWRQRAVGLGRRIHLEHQGRTFAGQLIDIDPTCAIIVQLDRGGRRHFDAAGTSILALED